MADAASRKARRPRIIVPVMRPSGRFPRSSRILHRWEFQRVQKEGVRIRTAAFTIVAHASPSGHARIGMAVSRKIGPSPVRNRIKRLLREIFRRTATSLPAIDLVMIAQSEAPDLAALGLAAMSEVVLPAWGRAAERALRPKARHQ